jgi:hypothetical protein
VLAITDDLITLRQAANLLPRRRAGKKPHFATVWRWATRGCHGVKLETISVGATLCTSARALQAFFERVTAARGIDTGASPARTPTQRARASERAAKRLEKVGI